MKIHEYQAKQIFAEAGIPVPDGEAVTTSAEVREVAEKYNQAVMVKAQVMDPPAPKSSHTTATIP